MLLSEKYKAQEKVKVHADVDAMDVLNLNHAME